MAYAQRKRNKRAATVENDSAVGLYSKLGGDETIPQSISFNGGTIVPIQTNAYTLTLTDQATIHQYDIKIEPEILHERTIRTFVYKAICGPDAGPMGANEKWQKVIFDGQHVLFSPLGDLGGEFTIPGRDDRPQDTPVKVTVTYVGVVSQSNPDALIQIYNLNFQNMYRTMHFEPFTRKWLDSSSQTRAGDFILTNGFTPSIQALSSGLSYVINTAIKIDRQGTLLEYLKKFENPSYRHEAEEALRSLTIVTTHNPRKPKLLQKPTVAWDATPFNTTFTKSGKNQSEQISMTIADYFRQVYNIQCKQDDILVYVETKKKDQVFREYYPASVLKVSGITDADRKNGRVMRDIASATRKPIGDRKRRLDEFVNRMNADPAAQEFLRRWGLSIGQSKELTGKLIPAPNMLFGENRTQLLSGDLSYKTALKNYSLLSPPVIPSAPLFIAERNDEKGLRELIATFRKVVNKLRFPFEDPVVMLAETGSPNDFNRIIVDEINKGHKPSYVFCLLPDGNKKRYDGIKHLLSSQLGIPSQFATTKTLEKNQMSIATNLVAQITAKTGGAICTVSPQSLKMQHTLVIGVSLTPSRGAPPVAAAVASYDRYFSQYINAAKTLDVTDRTISADFLTEFVQTAIDQWQKTNNDLPRNIVVYRDGCSYGQMPNVKKNEACKIQEFLTEQYPEIKFTFIICQKQGTIKIMLNDHGQNVNCQAGTVVTDQIGISNIAEFYLISHGVNQQATATPTRYTIIHSTPNAFKEDDHLIMLTHYLTLTYPNWQGPIRIPAHLMLAAKLAEQTRNHLGEMPNEERLKLLLHFL